MFGETNYTNLAADVVKKAISKLQVTSNITGKPAAIHADKAWFTTSKDYDGSEDATLFVSIPNVHDLGIDNVGNAVQEMLLQVPAIGQRFKFRMHGVPGHVIAAEIEKVLTSVGAPSALIKQLKEWEGLNPKTATPNVHASVSNESATFSLSPEGEEAKDGAPTGYNFKAMAEEIKGKHDAIMESIVKHAAALKDDKGQPLLSPEKLEALKQETLMIKDSKGEAWNEITLDIGKLKTDEATAKKPKDELNCSDFDHTSLSSLSKEQVKTILFDAVLEHVPQLYSKAAEPKRVAADLQKAVAGKVNIDKLLSCSQFHENSEYVIKLAGDEREERSIGINSVDSPDHPNTLKFSFDLPKDVPAATIISGLCQFGIEKGLIHQSAPNVTKMRNPANNNRPQTRVQEPGILGQIANAFWLNRR